MFSFDCYFYHPCHCPFIVLLIVGFTGAGGGRGGGGGEENYLHTHVQACPPWDQRLAFRSSLEAGGIGFNWGEGGRGKLFMCPYLLKVQACLPWDQRLASLKKPVIMYCWLCTLLVLHIIVFVCVCVCLGVELCWTVMLY